MDKAAIQEKLGCRDSAKVRRPDLLIADTEDSLENIINKLKLG